MCDPSGSEKVRDGGVVVNGKKAMRLHDGGLRWSERVAYGERERRSCRWVRDEKERSRVRGRGEKKEE